MFYTLKEVTWTYLLGWQWVAFGALIVVNVVYFQQGILGWLQERRPEWFGIGADAGMNEAGAARAARSNDPARDAIGANR